MFKPMIIGIASKELKGQLSIESIDLSWFGPQQFTKVQFANRDVVIKMDQFISPLPLWDAAKISSVFGVKNGNFSFPSYRNASIQQVNGKFDQDHFSLVGITKDGAQTGHIQIEGLYISSTYFDLSVDIEGLPVTAIDRLWDADGWLYETLGPNLSVKGKISLDEKGGSVLLAIKSSAIETNLQGLFNYKGIQLQNPLVVRWSPPFTFLAAAPTTTLTIFPNGFFLPIPFSIKDLTIDRATLDAGKIQCKNEGSLRSLVNFTKLGNYGLGQPIEVWLAPISFSFNNRLIEIERVDALIANSLHVCSWGTIDVSKQKYRLSLGLPADTLKQVFGIRDLPESYVLRIPLQGTLNNPTLVTGPAVAKIAALLAGQEVPHAKGVVGNVLQAISKGQEDDQAPPANRPFPWEK